MEHLGIYIYMRQSDLITYTCSIIHSDNSKIVGIQRMATQSHCNALRLFNVTGAPNIETSTDVGCSLGTRIHKPKNMQCVPHPHTSNLYIYIYILYLNLSICVGMLPLPVTHLEVKVHTNTKDVIILMANLGWGSLSNIDIYIYIFMA